jgi:hypothetical protein
MLLLLTHKIFICRIFWGEALFLSPLSCAPLSQLYNHNQGRKTRHQPTARRVPTEKAERTAAKTFSPPGRACAIRLFRIPESSKSFFLAPIFSSSQRCVVIFAFRPTTRLEFLNSLSFSSFYFFFELITRKITKIQQHHIFLFPSAMRIMIIYS